VRRAALTAVRAGLLLLALVLAFFSGGFFEGARIVGAICAWALLAVAVLAVPGSALPPARAARVALAALAGLAVWTWIAGSWSSSPAGADQELELALLYLPALAAGAIAWRERAAARAVEPALAAGALIVIGYGLSGRLLPGIVHLQASQRAGGRLEQPLTYWNATGALAAVGLVLCARLAGDATRPRALRIAAAAAAAPLGMGTYLSFSRGAIICMVAGLAALVAIDRTRAQLRAAAIALGAGVLAGAAAAPFGAVRALHHDHATAQGLIVLALLLAVTGAAAAVQARAPDGTAPLALRAAPAIAIVAVLAIVPYVAVVVAEGSGTKSEAAFGATNARLSDVGGHRLRYWRVAIDVAADHPLAGAGSGAFAVEWLRRRTIDERVRNAHSLELQTLADLGVVGLALLAAFLAAVVLAAGGALNAHRALAAGPAAGALTWALHAGLDWDWEMPALTLVAIALAGLLLCRAGAADGADQLADERALEPQAERHDDEAEDPDLDQRLGLRPA
jgi:O-antigen ligase/polysaccharide polymerase Wzy-like membrane protein